MAYLTLFLPKISKKFTEKIPTFGEGGSSRLGQIPNFYRKFVLQASLRSATKSGHPLRFPSTSLSTLLFTSIISPSNTNLIAIGNMTLFVDMHHIVMSYLVDSARVTGSGLFWPIHHKYAWNLSHFPFTCPLISVPACLPSRIKIHLPVFCLIDHVVIIVLCKYVFSGFLAFFD